MIRTGNIVIYRSGAALAEGLSGDKITIRTASGDQKNVREKDIVFLLHPGPAQRIPTAPPPPEESVLTETLELLDSEAMTFGELAELIYGQYTPDTALGLWELVQAGIYFRLEGNNVIPRSREDVEKSLAALHEKMAAKERHEALLQRLRTGNLLPEDRPSLSEVEQVALGITSSSRILKELGIEATPEKAHRLLLKLGVWDLFCDPLPSRAGIPLTDPAPAMPEMKDLPREDLTGLDSYAIDDESSHDPDDAISWKDGLLYVHTADPGSCIDFGSECDLEARERGENLYLPERVTHMLPVNATDRFGLGLSDTSPALTMVMRFQDDGFPVLEKICLSTVRVTRMTYDTAAPLLAKPEMQELLSSLEKFRAARKANGALFIRLPEVKILLHEKELEFIPTPITPEREFVANCMLAAGAAVAKWAAERDIPMPFVRQEPCDETGFEPNDESLPAMFALRRACHPGTTDTLPGLHAGLGLDPYVRMTSPLRRYSDLLGHMQIHRYLAEEDLLTADELTEALHTSEAAAAARRKLERLVNEYWTLVYFAQHAETLTPDTVFACRQDDRGFFLIPEFAYEYRTRFRGGSVGTEYRARILACEPASFTLRLALTSIDNADTEEVLETETAGQNGDETVQPDRQ